MPQGIESEIGVPDVPPFEWSRGKRWGVSVVLAVYLFILVLGPLSNPISSSNFSRPLADTVAPVHQALFLGHGYRFFGPDPGPSHLVTYRIHQLNGTVVEGRFPNAETTFPRLFYHRWFMVSETLFQELMFTPDQKSFDASQADLQKQIDDLKSRGKFDLVQSLEDDFEERATVYKTTSERIDTLIRATAGWLIQEHEGERIELFVQERLIASPLDIAAGARIDDEVYLSPPHPIGDFTFEELLGAELPQGRGGE